MHFAHYLYQETGMLVKNLGKVERLVEFTTPINMLYLYCTLSIFLASSLIFFPLLSKFLLFKFPLFKFPLFKFPLLIFITIIFIALQAKTIERNTFNLIDSFNKNYQCEHS